MILVGQIQPTKWVNYLLSICHFTTNCGTI